MQSGSVAGLTLNRSGQNAPAHPEHFALRFTDDGVGEIAYSSLDGSLSFNLVAAPLPVVESYGNTDLLEDSSGYYAGSASTPLLFSGTQVSPTFPNTFTAVGVDLVVGYRLYQRQPIIVSPRVVATLARGH